MSEEKSIREELEAAMSDEPEVETEVETEIETQPRDEKGRFAAKENDESGTDENQGDPNEAEVSAETVPETPVEPELTAPNGWSAEAKAKWGELAPEIQAAVTQREQDAHKRISKHDETRNFGESMQRVIQPYLAQIQAEGGTPETAIQSLLNTAYLLRSGTPEQKRALILQTAQQFGVDLSDTEMPQVSPEITALRNEFNQLRGHITTREQNERQNLQDEINQEVEAFASDPANVHYEKVKAHMAALLTQGAATDLKDAYDQACWSQPDIRATLLAQQSAEEEQKRKDDAKAKAEAARRKSVSLDGGTSGQPASPAPEDMSLREQLQAGFAAQSGAV